jgi:hypothetical protein
MAILGVFPPSIICESGGYLDLGSGSQEFVTQIIPARRGEEALLTVKDVASSAG